MLVKLSSDIFAEVMKVSKFPKPHIANNSTYILLTEVTSPNHQCPNRETFLQNF